MEERNRRALLIGAPADGLRGVGNDIEAMSQALERYGFALDICHGEEATQAMILERMERLIDGTATGDAVVVYFSGHGGRVPNIGRPGTAHPSGVPDHRQSAHYRYIVPVDIEDSSPDDFRGILEIELARVLARLTERTENVTVLMDCCHAEGVMRPLAPDGVYLREKRYSARTLARYHGICARIHERVAAMEGPVLHPSSNPHAVKLWAATSEQNAFERGVGEAPVMSVMTAALADVLDAGHGQDLTWGTVLEQVAARVHALIGGSQTPQLDGPEDRLVFTRERGPRVSVSASPWQGCAKLADIARCATSGSGESELLARFSITWGLVRDSLPEPRETFVSTDTPPNPVATLGAGACVYFALRNLDPTVKTYWHAFQIHADDRVELLTREARSGVPIQPRERPYVVGRRPDDRYYGWRLDGPADDGSERAHVFLFVVTDRPCDMRALESAGRAESASQILDRDLRAYMRASAAGPARRSLDQGVGTMAPVRHAVMRIGFRVAL